MMPNQISILLIQDEPTDVTRKWHVTVVFEPRRGLGVMRPGQVVQQDVPVRFGGRLDGLIETSR
jgi:hypothetical protein